MERIDYDCGCWENVSYIKKLPDGTREIGDQLDSEVCEAHTPRGEEDDTK